MRRLGFYTPHNVRRMNGIFCDTLEKCQKGSLDVSEWIAWYLGCLLRAIDESQTILASVLKKDEFWKEHAGGRSTRYRLRE